MKVTAITSGRNVPSSRFRVRQFITPLAKLGIFVTEYYARPNKYLTRRIAPVALMSRIPALLASRASQLTWLEREMIPGKITAERFTGGVRLLDVDDALWLNRSHDVTEEFAGDCAGVIAGNDYIANHYRPYAKRVWIVPTSVDTDRWRPADRATVRNGWNIGWIGTSSNFPFLYQAEDALTEFLAEYQDARLIIVSDSAPSFRKLPKESWRFQRWSERTEISAVQNFDVGLMPLPDSEWTRGKCSLKMLEYMAIGIPVIASPVGTAREIFAQGSAGIASGNSQDWYDALKSLYHDRELGRRMGLIGRAVVEQHYAVDKAVHRLAEIFRSVLENE